MGAPQIILTTLWAVNLGASIARHGNPGKAINAWDTVIAITATALILMWGGFWTC